MTEQQNSDEALPDALPEGSLLAAIDLGSNSFHLLIARIEHGELRPVEALAEKVQLGAGLKDGELSEEAIDRGLECLSRFAQLLESVEPERLRVVGTNALRKANNRSSFTRQARRILNTRVEVIYGREEARLVYLGVAHTLADDAQSRLVIDIGGGSTEFIIGERFEPQQMESLQLGCVSWARKFFPDGKIKSSGYRRAYDHACLETSHIRHRFRAERWAECVGASGTLLAIEALLADMGWCDGGIDRKGLKKLERCLLKFDTFDAIRIDALSEQRRNVILPGVAITSALFDVLKIDHMRTSKGGLREGLMYDLVGRLSHEDVRERTIAALIQRYGADIDTADIVERRARTLFAGCKKNWDLSKPDWEMLRWAARSHEIGMAISHRQFNRHSAYLLRNADLSGFSQEEQSQLAVLAEGHRGKIGQHLWRDIGDGETEKWQRLVALLRLAACFKYVEQLHKLPDFSIHAGAHSLHLDFPENWLQEHPLTAQELELEQKTLGKMDLKLSFS